MPRVLVIVDPLIPVPPVAYGGTERTAAFLCEQLVQRGWMVDLLAHPQSKKYSGQLYAHVPPTLNKLSRVYRKILFQFQSRKAARGADVIINFGRIDYCRYLLLHTDIPIVFNFQNPIAQQDIDWILQKRDTGVHFVGISQAQIQGLVPADRFTVVYNAADIQQLPFQPQPTKPSYFAFLGRLTPNKGVHLAIQAATQAGVRLKIAGNIPDSEPGASDYFAREIKPHLSDVIEYLGPVNDDQKAALLGGSTGLLFPIQWPEPFGIVLAEALACGCPVIGWRNGSVPEVIHHGQTGFIVSTLEEMVQGISQIGTINRSACRENAKLRFSPEAMAEGHLKVIDQLNQNRSGMGGQGANSARVYSS